MTRNGDFRFPVLHLLIPGASGSDSLGVRLRDPTQFDEGTSIKLRHYFSAPRRPGFFESFPGGPPTGSGKTTIRILPGTVYQRRGVDFPRSTPPPVITVRSRNHRCGHRWYSQTKATNDWAILKTVPLLHSGPPHHSPALRPGTPKACTIGVQAPDKMTKTAWDNDEQKKTERRRGLRLTPRVGRV